MEKQAANLRVALLDWLRENNVYSDIHQSLNILAQDFQQIDDVVLRQFFDMNQAYVDTVTIFRKGIDDRSYYQDQLADYECMKKLISKIQAASKDFLDTWALVVSE